MPQGSCFTYHMLSVIIDMHETRFKISNTVAILNGSSRFLKNPTEYDTIPYTLRKTNIT